jgi:hypothetical protein
MKERVLAPLLGVPVGVAIVWGAMLYAEPSPIERYEREARPLIVHAGEEVTIRWIEVRSSECSSVTLRTLLTSDSKVITFEPLQNSVKPIGINQGSFTFTVPPLATPGSLIYRVRSNFVCNWVQALFGGPTFILPDIQFEYRVTPVSAN